MEAYLSPVKAGERVGRGVIWHLDEDRLIVEMHAQYCSNGPHREASDMLHFCPHGEVSDLSSAAILVPIT